MQQVPPSMVSRVAMILESFDSSVELSASEIGRATGIPLPSTHRILQELVRVGFLEQDEGSRGYRLGLHLWELARRNSTHLELRDAAIPHLERLQSRFRCIAQLAVLQGTDIVYLEQVGDPSSVPNVTRAGIRLPAVACSPGLVLAAFSSPDRQQEVLNSKKARFTDHTVVDKGRLQEIVFKAQQEHSVTVDGWLHPETSGIAVPVLMSSGTAIASCSVLVRSDSSGRNAIKEQLMLTGRELAKTIKTRRIGVPDSSLEMLKMRLRSLSSSRKIRPAPGTAADPE